MSDLLSRVREVLPEVAHDYTCEADVPLHVWADIHNMLADRLARAQQLQIEIRESVLHEHVLHEHVLHEHGRTRLP